MDTHPSRHGAWALALTALLAAAVLATGFYLAGAAVRESHVRINQEYLKVAVEDRHVIIEEFLGDRLNLLKVLARAAASPEQLGQAALDRLFAQLVRTYGDYRSLAVLTRNGQRVSLAGEDSALTGDVSDQEWFTAALRTGEYISALYLDDDGNPRLAMATLTQAGEGQFVVRATLQLDTLYASLAELETGGDGGTYLVDPVTGLFLSRPYFGGQPLRDRNPAFDWGRKHFHVDYLEHGIEEVDAGSYTRADGAAVIEAHCCTREGDWLVVVERESAEVERQSQALLTELGLLAAATLAALALVTAAGLRLARRRAG